MSKTNKTTKPKPVKKSAASAKPKSLKTLDSAPVFASDEPVKTNSPKTDSGIIAIKKTYALIAVIILIGLGVVGTFYGGKLLVVAQVNGKSIGRLDYIREMEAQVGQQTLENMITEELIYQKAQAEGVTVTAEVVDQEIETVRETLTAQGQDLDQLLQMQGMTQAQLRRQIELQKLLAQLAGVSEEVPEEELNAYIEENADFFPEDMTDEERVEYARDRYLAENNQDKIQTYIQELRTSASIQYTNSPL